MRLITVDNGNTHTTVAYFDRGVLSSVVPLEQYSPNKDDIILISSVGKPLSLRPTHDLKEKRTKTHFFDMKVNYAETLGDDRLIASYGLYKKLKAQEKVLLIDAGTFITCDIVSSAGFEGGYIFPGINRFLKIYSDSAQLPHLSKDLLFKDAATDLPHTTDEAIIKACEIYLKASLEEVIKKNAPDKIVFTGGNALEIKNFLSLTIRSELDRHLVHSALSLIHAHHYSQA